MRDFYLGYSPKSPPALARFIEKIVLGLALLVAAIALLLVRGQAPFENSTFEFGKLRTLVGTIVERPYPTLLVAHTGESASPDRYLAYLLVAPGKHGAGSSVAGFDSKKVRMQGTLIYRDGRRMLELVPGSITTLGAAPAKDEALRDLGPVTATGEIVDSKCYLGVMNPGQGKVHRSCAARCLSGGIPPLFVVENALSSGSDGVTGGQFLLVGPSGLAIGPDALREFVAEPITVHGELLQRGGMRFLQVDPHTLRHRSVLLP